MAEEAGSCFKVLVRLNHTAVNRPCSVRRALEVVGDRWNFLILRETFFGLRRFENIRRNIGIAKNILSRRLQALVANGVLDRQLYQKHPRRFEYRLTEKGMDLYPVILMLIRWGDRWLAGSQGPPLLLFHKKCGHLLSPMVACPHCNTEVVARQVRYENGPGGFFSGHEEVTHPNWRWGVVGKSDTRACSVRRTLELVSDWWTFLVLREAFFGVRRFDQMQGNLGIARNILSNRLLKMVDNGIFNRQPYQDRPKRFEYNLTEQGLDLYPMILMLIRWGDRWLSRGKGPPLFLFHKPFGQRIEPVATCASCSVEIDAREVNYKPGPGFSMP